MVSMETHKQFGLFTILQECSWVFSLEILSKQPSDMKVVEHFQVKESCRAFPSKRKSEIM